MVLRDVGDAVPAFTTSDEIIEELLRSFCVSGYDGGVGDVGDENTCSSNTVVCKKETKAESERHVKSKSEKKSKKSCKLKIFRKIFILK